MRGSVANSVSMRSCNLRPSRIHSTSRRRTLPCDSCTRRAHSAAPGASCSEVIRAACAARRRSASPSERRSNTRQRERMVGSRRPGAAASNRKQVRAGGSSSDFSSALAAFRLSSSAVSTMTTRLAPAADVCPRNDLMRRTSSTGIEAVKRLAFGSQARRMTSRPGCDSALTCRAAVVSAATSRLCPKGSRSPGSASMWRANR